MGNVSPTPHQLFVEAVVFWSIGLIIYVGRMVSRIILHGSLKGLFWDDYIMTATFMIYTALLILIQISSRYATNLMDPKDYDMVLSDPKQVSDRIFGSKIVIGLEQCMLFSTWGVKTCMLIFYWRLTKSLRSNLHIKILIGYVVLGFVVIMVTYYAVYCRPFSQYWAMPVQNMQCATYQHYSITQAVFNISSDAVMFAVPIPILIRAQLKKHRKVLLICVMSLGLFTIIAAILNKFFNFASPLTTTYQIWYIREASTAIYVANLMCWWPLLRKIFGFRAFSYNSNRAQRRNGDPNSGNKFSNSYSNSGESSSRPSFSFPRALNLIRPGIQRPGKNMQGSHRDETHRSSQEAIARASRTYMDPRLEEAHPLDEWSLPEERGADPATLEHFRSTSLDTLSAYESAHSKRSDRGDVTKGIIH